MFETLEQEKLDEVRPALKELIQHLVDEADTLANRIADNSFIPLDDASIALIKGERLKSSIDRTFVNSGDAKANFAKHPQGVALINELLAECGADYLTLSVSFIYS